MLGVSTRMVEFIGGSWDGVCVTLKDPTEWVWVTGDPGAANRPRCYRSPGADREPYHAVLSARPSEECSRELVSYLYAGHAFARCGGCGALHALRDGRGRVVPACTLCGYELSRGVVSGEDRAD